MAREYHVVDADCHVFNPKDYYQKWWPRKYQDQAPKLIKDAEGGDFWQYEPGAAVTGLGISIAVGKRYEDLGDLGTSYDNIRPGTYNSKERLKDMDIDGVDAQIVYSDNRPMGYFMGVKDQDLHLMAVQQYNNWLKDEFNAPDPERLIGLGQIPNLGIEAAISELHRIKSLGLRGAILRAWPSGKNFLTAEDDPFWKAAEEMQIPITNHGFAAKQGFLGKPDSSLHPHAAALGAHIGIGTSVMPYVLQLITTGVFDRFPGLRMGCIETQAGWVPFVMEQMDDKYYRRKFPLGIKLKYLPSEYWKRNWFATFMIDKYAIRNRDIIGVDTLQWSSDYPHHGNDWPFSQKVIEYTFFGVAEAETRKMVCGNAAREFHLV